MGQCHGHKKWITSLAWEPAHKAYPSARFCTGSKDNMVKVREMILLREGMMVLSNGGACSVFVGKGFSVGLREGGDSIS